MHQLDHKFFQKGSTHENQTSKSSKKDAHERRKKTKHIILKSIHFGFAQNLKILLGPIMQL